MPDAELADLTAITSLDGDEILYVVDDPSGTPADRKVTVDDLLDVLRDNDATITSQWTFDQQSGETPLTIDGTNPATGNGLLKVLGPVATGAIRYIFMVNEGGSVKTNTSMLISGTFSSQIPSEPFSGASYMLGIVNDLAAGYPSILSKVGVSTQDHLHVYDTTDALVGKVNGDGAWYLKYIVPLAFTGTDPWIDLSTHTLLKVVATGDGVQMGTATTQKIGFYGTAPIAKQTGVAVSAAGIHAALVALGLIAA